MSQKKTKIIEKELIKILFILPPNISFDDFIRPPRNISTITKNNGKKQFGSLITDIPLGIISLSAYLKKSFNMHNKSLDFNVELNKETEFSYHNFIDYFFDKISLLQNNFQPHYICLSSLFTPAYQSIIDLAEVSKHIFPNSMVLVGGNLPTSLYKEILRDSKYVDAICYGEGELPFQELLFAEDKLDFFQSHPSWVTRKKVSDKKDQLSHQFIGDLDEIPFLDYDILDLEGYKLNPTSSRYAVSDNYMTKLESGTNELEKAIGKNISTKIPYSMPIMTSRGCPFKCTFCASHKAHGRDMRYNSISRVNDDLKLMVEKYGISGVVIQDDHFMGGKRRPYEIVKKINDNKLMMFFQNALAIYALDYEFLELLKNSGVTEIVLPIESGSSRVLKDLMKKPLRLDLIPKVVSNCRKVGLYSDCNIILGMPGETKQDIDDSRKFLKSIYADWFRVFVATPIPGSEMYEACLSNDLFLNNESILQANYKKAVLNTNELTPEYVQEMTYIMNIELNFVYNSNYRLGNYGIALESFLNVIKIKNDHALAFYYAALCYEKLGMTSKYEHFLQKSREIVEKDSFWIQFIEMFKIPIYESEIVSSC
jgi:anaerobic magnesium-protoporphyrin IX monomethyl ester cyclase